MSTEKATSEKASSKSVDGPINLADRIELRRFVGREYLLWLWLESELFEATLETKPYGSFGLWLEGRLVLDEGKESTTIKGTSPGLHREAKESLLRGKTPERAGLHLSFGDHDCTVTLKGETLAFAGLTPPLKEKEEASAEAVLKDAPKKKRAPTMEVDEHDAFYERMHFAKEVEALMAALYRDFLTLRLSPAWDKTFAPAITSWVAGDSVDVDRYRSARARALNS